jgi:osmotically-inducible protein OsmY
MPACRERASKKDLRGMSYSMQTITRGSFLALWITWLITSPSHGAGRPEAMAHVPEELRRSEAYTLYSKMLVEIDLRANPRTAGLPITVAAIRPGSLVLEGRVSTARLQEYLVQNAQRITGLSIEEHFEVGEVADSNLFSPPARELEAEVQATISGFFPDEAPNIRVTVRDNGIVELNGELRSYESKLNVSRVVKSQQGCRAVVNLIRVPADPDLGTVRVSDDGSLSLDASQLPIIPAAPLVDLDPASDNHPPLTQMRGFAAGDDTPNRNPSNVKLSEDVQAMIESDPELATADLSVDVEGKAVVITGKIDSKQKVEEIVSKLSDVPDVPKIILKSRPYSMQRSFPPGSRLQEGPKEKTFAQKLTSWVPGASSSEPIDQIHSWRFRESIRRQLAKMCDKRLIDLKVSTSSRGLQIEGEVKSARDRAFVLKQVDNVPELRPIPTDVILRVAAD